MARLAITALLLAAACRSGEAPPQGAQGGSTPPAFHLQEATIQDIHAAYKAGDADGAAAHAALGAVMLKDYYPARDAFAVGKVRQAGAVMIKLAYAFEQATRHRKPPASTPPPPLNGEP